MEQQALLDRQSASAKVGNKVREKSSLSEAPRRKRTKESWTKDNNRKLWECYLRSKPKKKGDFNVVRTEDWKVEKYQDLAFEVQRIHHVETAILPVVIGALGTVAKRLIC